MKPKRTAIIGAGPIGLEAAIYSRALGHDLVVYERGTVADNVGSWGFVKLFSPWSMDTSPLGRQLVSRSGDWTIRPNECPTGTELREHYLLPLARTLGDAIRENTTVIAVGKDDFFKSDAIGSAARAESPFRILLRDTTGKERIEHADVVLDCSGTYGHHRWAGRGGVPAPGERELENRIWYTIPDVLGKDRARFANRHALLLGAGHSAATVLKHLSELVASAPQTRVTWSIRRPGQALQEVINDPLPARKMLVSSILELHEKPPPWLQFLGTCVLECVKLTNHFDVTLKHVTTNLAMSVDEIVALVGYSPDDATYEQLQVHQCYATSGPIKVAAALLGEGSSDCLTAGERLHADLLRNPEPNFYILGAKSYGSNSNFLMRVGHHQVRDVFKLIEQKPELDLYST